MDYILSNKECHVINYDDIILEQYSDHVLLFTALKVAIQPPPTPAATSAATPTPPAATTYRWDVGATIQDQAAGIKRWKEHTSTEEFQQGMEAIVEDTRTTNEEKTDLMEKYFLEAGERAGVIRECSMKPPLNPNRWGKHLAPWFDGDCREAKKQYRGVCREWGRGSREATEALREFIRVCRRAKGKFARDMPDMLKKKPA